MKKIKAIALFSLLTVLGLASCQQTEERACQDVANKIQNNEALTDDDYTRMIEYVGDYAQKAEQYVVNDNSEQLQGELQQLNKEYPLVDTFRNCIKNTPLDKFNSDNMALLQKYGGLTEFDVPEGMTLQTDKDAAGLIVETPQNQQDSAVVAGAVDEAKIENK